MSTLTASTPVESTDVLSKKVLAADHPTWCPGCGDFAVLSSFYKALEKSGLKHENIVVIAGIGCSSRFPYFVNTHGVHFIHGRAIPLASGVSLAREDVHVFVFGGDGDGYSIGGNHLTHGARKNIRLTYVIMDNFVYGLTKKQTSPTSPIGFKTKTDPTGATDTPINPMKKLIASGATMIARSHAAMPAHMIELFSRAMKHDGFSVIEVLSECVEFYPGAFDAANSRKGGQFVTIAEKSEANPAGHDVTNEMAAYQLADEPFPGKFGVYYQVQRPTKNQLEQQLIKNTRQKVGAATSLNLLQSTFDRMK